VEKERRENDILNKAQPWQDVGGIRIRKKR